ncbi:hypothetical protein [Mumia flava]|uniref:hypothetical protein n=1 Tax=Mumia flava TaxID=1348852 RepID=UPI000C2473B1|nr:hypothetical protein [Mumia flava]
MVTAVVVALVAGIALGALLVWFSSRAAARVPEATIGRRLPAVAPGLRAGSVITSENTVVDEVTLAEMTRLLTEGKRLEATRLLHVRTGLTLLAAKSQVAEWETVLGVERATERAHAALRPLDHPEVSDAIAEQVRELLGRGKTFKAMKLLRSRTTMRLTTAAHYIDTVRRHAM